MVSQFAIPNCEVCAGGKTGGKYVPRDQGLVQRTEDEIVKCSEVFVQIFKYLWEEIALGDPTYALNCP